MVFLALCGFLANSPQVAGGLALRPGGQPSQVDWQGSREGDLRQEDSSEEERQEHFDSVGFRGRFGRGKFWQMEPLFLKEKR